MSRWRITHVAPTGLRQRLLVSAASVAAAQASALLALGEARALSCIRLDAAAHQNNKNTQNNPCQIC